MRTPIENRDARGNMIDPHNPWPKGAPWWFDANAIYTRWRSKHDAQVARAALTAAREEQG